MKVYNLNKLRMEVLREFKNASIDAVDAHIIFCEVFKLNRAELLLKQNATAKQVKEIKKLVKLRLSGMPITKIFKCSYFYGLKFYVNNYVLSPRKETEILVEQVLKSIKTNYKVLDLCSGSGAIAVSIKKNSDATVFASDISSKALKVAKFNAKTQNVDICFIKSNLFDKIKGKFNIIVSNPPYIKTGDLTNLSNEVKNYDPIIALDGGTDGLDFYRNIIKNSGNYLESNGMLFLEIGYTQCADVCKILEEYSFNYKVIKDYSNIDRIIIGEKNER